jgi:hypothetical protein
MEVVDYAKVKNKVSKPEKRVAKEKVPVFSSDDKLRAQFSTVSNSKKRNIPLNNNV